MFIYSWFSFDYFIFVFFFKQKTAYEMRISDWSSDVCSSDLFRRIDGFSAFQNFLHFIWIRGYSFGRNEHSETSGFLREDLALADLNEPATFAKSVDRKSVV